MRRPTKRSTGAVPTQGKIEAFLVSVHLLCFGHGSVMGTAPLAHR